MACLQLSLIYARSWSLCLEHCDFSPALTSTDWVINSWLCLQSFVHAPCTFVSWCFLMRKILWNSNYLGWLFWQWKRVWSRVKYLLNLPEKTLQMKYAFVLNTDQARLAHWIVLLGPRWSSRWDQDQHVLTLKLCRAWEELYQCLLSLRQQQITEKVGRLVSHSLFFTRQEVPVVIRIMPSTPLLFHKAVETWNSAPFGNVEKVYNALSISKSRVWFCYFSVYGRRRSQGWTAYLQHNQA